MSDTIKCTCPHCQAKYRLPLEVQGRTARCKRCGGRFEVPVEKSLEDSILDWLSDAEAADETVSQPRVISMPREASAGSEATRKSRGPIRVKSAGQPAAKTGQNGQSGKA